MAKECGNKDCCVSTGIHEGLTFGSGYLDKLGFWEKPCCICARAHEKEHPKDGQCWPYDETCVGPSPEEIKEEQEELWPYGVPEEEVSND